MRQTLMFFMAAHLISAMWRAKWNNNEYHCYVLRRSRADGCKFKLSRFGAQDWTDRRGSKKAVPRETLQVTACVADHNPGRPALTAEAMKTSMNYEQERCARPAVTDGARTGERAQPAAPAALPGAAAWA